MTGAVQDKLNALVDRVKKVRRWLAALAILKIAALCVVFEGCGGCDIKRLNASSGGAAPKAFCSLQP